MSKHEIKIALEVLQESGRYRVLEAMGAVQQSERRDEDEPRSGLVLDVETTGLDRLTDKVIEIGLLKFEYDAKSGRVLNTGEPVSFFEDPGFPIPDVVTGLTGITDEMVTGQVFDDATVAAAMDSASLIIAHNASFDRPFVERRFGQAASHYWACTLDEIPWGTYGFRCAKLECLLTNKNSMYFESHRAGSDCMALLHLISRPFSDGVVPLDLLLQSARQKSVPVIAAGAPFDVKDVLKRNGYRWNDGTAGGTKAWWKEVFESSLASELDWLAENGYAGVRDRWILGEPRDARSRYRDG